MEELNIYYDNLILIPTVTFMVTVILKGIYVKITTGAMNVSQSLWSWWMPSVHSAVVVSLATAVLLKHGIESDLFAIVIWFTVIIIYDAINVRYEAWLHASAINESIWEKKFKESLWHLPSEAFGWSLVWIIIAVILFYM